MEYRITDMSIEHSCDTISTQYLGKTVTMPGTSYLEATIRLNIYEYNDKEVDSLDAFEQALKESKVKDGAPSYHDLLKKYHPEFLL